MKNNQKVYGIPNTVAALGRARVSQYRATVERRFREQLGAGGAPAETAHRFIARARRVLTATAKPNLSTAAESLVLAQRLPYVIQGIACPVGKGGRPNGGPDDEVLTFYRDAFSSVPDTDCSLVVNHYYDGDADDAGQVLASREAGSLFLWTDDRGLHFRARLPDTVLGRVVTNKLQRGECRGVSGSFRFRSADTAEYGGGHAAVERTRVAEISLLFDREPAFPGTSATLLRCHTGLSVCDPDFTRLVVQNFDQQTRPASQARGGMSVAEARRRLRLVGRDGIRRGPVDRDQEPSGRLVGLGTTAPAWGGRGGKSLESRGCRPPRQHGAFFEAFSLQEILESKS
ncbi:MAG: hypothetical protein GXX96_35290 [Planctomycetaceae bacterium]|mgnify:CR=1 FL=1|nr:hypothetical protein [Planctomycetaceae bacterium]